jgi:hypothetical protein
MAATEGQSGLDWEGMTQEQRALACLALLRIQPGEVQETNGQRWLVLKNRSIVEILLELVPGLGRINTWLGENGYRTTTKVGFGRVDNYILLADNPAPQQSAPQADELYDEATATIAALMARIEKLQRQLAELQGQNDLLVAQAGTQAPGAASLQKEVAKAKKLLGGK